MPASVGKPETASTFWDVPKTVIGTLLAVIIINLTSPEQISRIVSMQIALLLKMGNSQNVIKSKK